MSKIKTFGILTSIMVVGLSSTGVAFWYVTAKNDERLGTMKLQNEMSVRSAAAASEFALGRPVTIPLGARTTKQPSNDTNTLKVGNSVATSTQAQVPGSNDFKSYDQYLTAESSLYGDMLVGTGTEVTSSTKVAVTYKGWLTNGTLFDETKADSTGKMQPFVFQMGAKQVIPGWEQGVLGMKVGGKRRIIVPPAVGYGATAKDPIPANSVLVFDVEVVAAL